MKLYTHEGQSEYRLATADEVIKRAKQILVRRHRRGSTLRSPSAAQDLCRMMLADLRHELFCILWLDNRHRILDFEELFRGTIDGATVYPREVVKSALAHDAAACILAHSHPSGSPEPSTADEHITKRVRDALALIDVRVLDHLVVGNEGCVSFAERGLI